MSDLGSRHEVPYDPCLVAFPCPGALPELGGTLGKGTGLSGCDQGKGEGGLPTGSPSPSKRRDEVDVQR